MHNGFPHQSPDVIRLAKRVGAPGGFTYPLANPHS
jgi:hypothetical protein